MQKRSKNSVRSLKRSVKGISPVIATLLMIVIAVAASLVAYAWVMGYLGFTTAKTGKAIQIQSIAKVDSDTILVYVQNVGDSSVELSSLYVNDELDTPASSAIAGTMLAQGETLEIQSDGYYDDTAQVKVKVVAMDGTFMELTKTFTS